MAYVWMQGNSFTKIATIYQGNITLNTSCFDIFNGINWCLVGIDRENKKVAIKLVTEEERQKNKYIPEVLNHISLGKSYIRISNKNIVNEISNILNKEMRGNKFLVDFEQSSNQVIIDLTKTI